MKIIEFIKIAVSEFFKFLWIFILLVILSAGLLGLVRQQSKPEGHRITTFLHNDDYYYVYLKDIEVRGFDEYFTATSHLPKRQTDSIYSIRYLIYQDKIYRYSLKDDITLYPWTDDLLRGHPTEYTINLFKEKLKTDSINKAITDKFSNYLKL